MASARGKRIEAARKRVDARRAALGPYGDRPTARDRAIQRHAQWSGGSETDKTGKRKRILSPVEKEIREAGSTAGTQFRDVKDFAKTGIGKLFGQMPSAAKYIGMLTKGLTRHGEEVDAASRDYDIPFFKGGNPIAVDRGSYVDQFLEPLMGDNKRAYNQAVRDDKVFWGDLEGMSGDNYEASHPGLIALLNDPSRLNKLQKDDPIRALNYMRSITGDPSNMGFDEFEAWRQAEGRTEKERGLTATQIAQQLLPQYRQQAADMYGEGFLGNKAREYVDVDPAIMNYQDPIRDMVAPTRTGQSMVDVNASPEQIENWASKWNQQPGFDENYEIQADLNPRIPPLSQSELMNVSEQNLMPTYDYGVYGDPMDNILSGEPGSGTGSLLLQSMYPGYRDFADTDEAQKYGLEDMNERELMEFGYKNPPIASMFGFNPENYPDYGY